MDLWSVQEVVDPAHFAALVASLPGYGGLLATDPVVTDGARYYSDFDGQEQKVGLIYKASVATVRSARVILGAQEREFAGRPPVEVELFVTVDGRQFELILILVHAKAGSGQPDWEQRNAAAALLKDYLDRTNPAGQVMVVGDFNDDVDVSITPPNPSPYKRFVDDSTAYFVPTKALTDAGKSSTVDFTEMIDHHLVTDELKGAYLPNSAEVFPADQYLASYRRTTSDHYPVLARYLPGQAYSSGRSLANDPAWRQAASNSRAWKQRPQPVALGQSVSGNISMIVDMFGKGWSIAIENAEVLATENVPER